MAQKRESQSKWALIALTCTLLLVGSIKSAQADDKNQQVSDLLAKGNAAMDEGRLPEAQASFESAIKLDSRCAAAHNQLGLCYSRQNQPYEAAGEFSKALDADPGFLPSLNNLGSVMYRLGKYDAAINYYEKALAVKKDNDPEVHTNLASVLRDRATFGDGRNRDSDIKDALKHYNKAISLRPDFAQAHNNLGLYYLRLKQLQAAEQAVKKAIELKHDYAAAYFNLGLIEQSRGRMSDALLAFQNSLRYETVPSYAEGTRRKIKELGLPQNATDHFSRGYDFLVQKKYAEAEVEFRQVVAGTDPKNAVAWNNLGYAIFKQGRLKESISAYQKATQLMPGKFPAAQYNLGQAYRLAGDLKSAEKHLRKSLQEAKERHALAHNALALVLKQKGDAQNAAAHYRLALMQSGDTLPVVHFNQAILLEQNGKKLEAAEEFTRYLSQEPDGPNAAIAREHLTQLTGAAQ